MKPPVTIDALIDEWNKDAPIDKTEPHKALEKLPRLHAKYLTIRSHHRMVIKELDFRYDEMKVWKKAYYRGELNNPEDLTKYNVEICPKNYGRDAEDMVATDPDVVKLLMRKTIHQEIVDYCDSVLGQLTTQNWTLGSIIKWRTYINDTSIEEN